MTINFEHRYSSIISQQGDYDVQNQVLRTFLRSYDEPSIGRRFIVAIG